MMLCTLENLLVELDNDDGVIGNTAHAFVVRIMRSFDSIR
jgi:hypothetical protein